VQAKCLLIQNIQDANELRTDLGSQSNSFVPLLQTKLKRSIQWEVIHRCLSRKPNSFFRFPSIASEADDYFVCRKSAFRSSNHSPSPEYPIIAKLTDWVCVNFDMDGFFFKRISVASVQVWVTVIHSRPSWIFVELPSWYFFEEIDYSLKVVMPFGPGLFDPSPHSHFLLYLHFNKECYYLWGRFFDGSTHWAFVML